MADLIRMSEATALGLHTMAAVARRDEPTPAAQIAEELHASEAHLSKVLQRLVRGGLLRSKRGPFGGYTLANALIYSAALLSVLQGAYLLGLVAAIGCGRVRHERAASHKPRYASASR